MREAAARTHSILGGLFVEPARMQILEDHHPTEGEARALTEELVKASAFCADDRRPLVARALASGLLGDFTLATHLLVPQVEEAMRHLLRGAGVITSGLTEDEIQLQFNLRKTLRMPELVQLLGTDPVFDLEGLLVDPLGTNLRNNVAHGLLSAEQFASATGRYFWWVVLHLVLGLRRAPASGKTGEKGPPQGLEPQ